MSGNKEMAYKINGVWNFILSLFLLALGGGAVYLAIKGDASMYVWGIGGGLAGIILLCQSIYIFSLPRCLIAYDGDALILTKPDRRILLKDIQTVTYHPAWNRFGINTYGKLTFTLFEYEVIKVRYVYDVIAVGIVLSKFVSGALTVQILRPVQTAQNDQSPVEVKTVKKAQNAKSTHHAQAVHIAKKIRQTQAAAAAQDTQNLQNAEPLQDLEPTQDAEPAQDAKPAQETESSQDVKPTQNAEPMQDAK